MAPNVTPINETSGADTTRLVASASKRSPKPDAGAPANANRASPAPTHARAAPAITPRRVPARRARGPPPDSELAGATTDHLIRDEHQQHREGRAQPARAQPVAAQRRRYRP